MLNRSLIPACGFAARGMSSLKFNPAVPATACAAEPVQVA
jgi:hypothetical protein